MSLSFANFSLDRLRKYNGPEFFLGGGFVAGLLLFLIWLSLLPESERRYLGSPPVAGGNTALGLQSPAQGVLGGITGGEESPPGAAQAAFPQAEQDLGDQAMTAGDDASAPAMPGDENAIQDGEQAASSAPPDDSQAIANSLLDRAPATPAPEGAPPPAQLQTYFVEVMSAPGEFEILQVNAESSDDARAIVRAARGDARITRGPSIDPLD